VQYGGRITDNLDRRLFTAYTEAWLSQQTLSGSFSFNPETSINRIPKNFNYRIPNFSDLEEYMNFISKIPDVDSPEVLGLHPNADLTFR
jgi:dynein heavy chain